MSTIKVTNLSGRGGASPTLPDGAVVTGVATATTFSGTLDGSLKTTGTPTLGLGVTINASGVAISGVATAGIVSATTLYGDGSNLTGIAVTISPINYNPDVGGNPNVDTGIGISFNQAIIAGSGDIKIRQVGAAGTIIESFGVGSSISISGGTFNFTPTSDFANDSVIFLDIPAGAFTSPDGSTSSVAIGYTFNTTDVILQAFTWGQNDNGELGQNNNGDSYRKSSPVQIPGSWVDVCRGMHEGHLLIGVKNDGTLWAWGNNTNGGLGQNNVTQYSSPIQIGSDTTWGSFSTDNSKLSVGGRSTSAAIKTDGTLWTWGDNEYGILGQNTAEDARVSSPVQVPGTTWSVISLGFQTVGGIKTDGTLWTWGRNNDGMLGQNTSEPASVSSPVQIPGTTWNNVVIGNTFGLATRTDGTMWSWGGSGYGESGRNVNGNPGRVSSPTQIPGTSWTKAIAAGFYCASAVRTDGTLWTWGLGDDGFLGDNSVVHKSSPTQIPGTDWGKTIKTNVINYYSHKHIKTDGTLWAWGYNNSGELGQNNITKYSSPVQVGSGTQWSMVGGNPFTPFAVVRDTTP